ncbi:MAG: FmdB family zinc ribbon protein [Actinomycetes bacterium]
MPKYSYVCTACSHAFEQQQSFEESALTSCPICKGELRKEFGVGGISFKGSGFYRTDSAVKPAAKPEASSES